jgi:hypothetical protein
VADHQRNSGAYRGIPDAFGVLEIARYRFFNKHRNAALDEIQRNLRVVARGDGNRRGVDLMFREKRSLIGVSRDGERSVCFSHTLGTGVRDGDQTRAIEAAQDPGMVRAHGASADDRDPKVTHHFI